MLSPTLSQGLERYRIGPKLRTLRLRKKMGLVELGQHTGLSPAMLSKLERSRLFPTLPTLLRIALVFGVGLEFFFSAGPDPLRVVVRRDERRRFPERPNARQVSYHFECLDFPATNRPMNSYLVEFDEVPESAALPHSHPGVELLYLIEGELIVGFTTGEEALHAGDSIYFDATEPHRYRRSGAKRCRAVVVTAS